MSGLDRFSCGFTPRAAVEVGTCEACSGVIFDYELIKCETCDARIHEGCAARCDICGRKGCKVCLSEKDGLLMCEECKKESIENFVERLSMPLAEALHQFGYWLTGKVEKDGQLIFEFTAQNAPRLEVRIGKKESEND